METRSMTPIRFTIPLPPITKKNSGRIVQRGDNPKLLPSEAFERYQEEAGYHIRCKWAAINQPVNVKALYFMKEQRKVDIVNLHSALHDILVHYGVLADDSSLNPEIVRSTDGSRVFHDKANPRTEVEITSAEGETV